MGAVLVSVATAIAAIFLAPVGVLIVGLTIAIIYGVVDPFKSWRPDTGEAQPKGTT